MPKSRGRGARGRGGKTTAQARKTQADQRKAEAKRRISLRAHRARRALGWSLVVLAVAVGISHWFEHLGVISFAAPGVEDLVAGFPMAGGLALAGVLVLSKA